MLNIIKEEILVEESLKNKLKFICDFCQSIKKDIAPVKNAISYNISSGFVEGNNNKFKLIKRIVYGKSKLVFEFRFFTKNIYEFYMIRAK